MPDATAKTSRIGSFFKWLFAAIGAIGVIAAIFWGLNQHFRWVGAAPPNIDVAKAVPQTHEALKPNNPESKRTDDPITPLGDDLPTIVAIRNRGSEPALVQYVEFEIKGEAFKTPPRPTAARQGPVIPVTFIHDDKHPKKILRFNLPKPTEAPGDAEWTTLKLAIVSQMYSGWSYRGAVTVNFANTEPQRVENVELDILKEPPK